MVSCAPTYLRNENGLGGRDDEDASFLLSHIVSNFPPTRNLGVWTQRKSYADADAHTHPFPSDHFLGISAETHELGPSEGDAVGYVRREVDREDE